MSFSVSARGGAFEWSGRTTKVLDGLFARRRNIVSPGYLRMLGEVLRFNRQAPADRRAGRLADLSLGEYLAGERYSPRFRDDYIVPMGAAIWSTPADRMLDFPAESLVAFFENHRLLVWNRPVWRTVTGGSRNYVAALTAPLRQRTRLGCQVVRILRHDLGVDVTDAGGHAQRATITSSSPAIRTRRWPCSAIHRRRRRPFWATSATGPMTSGCMATNI
jgi:predicted NAD/FAD-binding protein